MSVHHQPKSWESVQKYEYVDELSYKINISKISLIYRHASTN